MTVSANRIGIINWPDRSEAGREPLKPAVPRTRVKLNRFDPTTLPSAMSCRLCCRLASKEMISGRDVPTATIVKPMTSSDQP